MAPTSPSPSSVRLSTLADENASTSRDTLDLPLPPDGAPRLPPAPASDAATNESNSENDNERPIREKLKKAHLGPLISSTNPSTDVNGRAEEVHELPSSGGLEAEASSSRQNKVGSDGDSEATGESSGHDQTQSSTKQIPERPETPQHHSAADEFMEDAKASLLSPKKKRSRDQFDKDDDREGISAPDDPIALRGASEDGGGSASVLDRGSRTSRDEPEKKRHRETSQEASERAQKSEAQTTLAGGFSNTSTISPFGVIAAGRGGTSQASAVKMYPSSDQQPQTSSSAFAASGFGALAGSSTSPFGTLGSTNKVSTSSPFGVLGENKQAASGFGAPSGDGPKGQPSIFGGPLAKDKAFGMGPSAFGQLTGAFVGGFSTTGGSKIEGLSEKPVRAFGMPDEGSQSEDDGSDGDNEEEGESEGEDAISVQKETKEVTTGEEGEITRFSARAKLYYFKRSENSWKQRGAGSVKLNVALPSEDIAAESAEDEQAEDTSSGSGSGDKKHDTDPGIRARLIMRSDGVHRVILNTPILKQMKFGDKEGKAPREKVIIFGAIEDEKIVMMQLVLSTEANAKTLWQTVVGLQDEMRAPS